MRPTEILNNALRFDVHEFCNILAELNYKLPEHVVMELYNARQYKKLIAYFQIICPYMKLQDKFLFDKNMRLIDAFCKKWSFDPRLHYALLKKPIEVLRLAFVKTKLTEEAEIKLVKTLDKEIIILYASHQKLSKKAKNIAVAVRKVKIN